MDLTFSSHLMVASQSICEVICPRSQNGLGPEQGWDKSLTLGSMMAPLFLKGNIRFWAPPRGSRRGRVGPDFFHPARFVTLLPLTHLSGQSAMFPAQGGGMVPNPGSLWFQELSQAASLASQDLCLVWISQCFPEEGLVAVSLAVTCTESFPTFLLTTGTSEVTVEREK